MTRPTLLIMFAAVLLSVIGQFLLKAGATALGPIGGRDLLTQLLLVPLQPLILLGLSVYGVSAVGFIVVLSRANLSVVSPLIATSYIFTVLGGNVFFGEVIPPLRWVGVGLIILGVALVLRTNG